MRCTPVAGCLVFALLFSCGSGESTPSNAGDASTPPGNDGGVASTTDGSTPDVTEPETSTVADASAGAPQMPDASPADASPALEASSVRDSAPVDVTSVEAAAVEGGSEGGAAPIDLGAGQGNNSGLDPAALVDAMNGKLLVAVTDMSVSEMPALVRCNLDGTACTYTDITVGQPAKAQVASAALDVANQKVLVLATETITTPVLYRCNLDGTACTRTVLSSSTVDSGLTGLVDTVNQKLLVATTDDTNSEVALLRCALDGTGCTFTDLMAGQPFAGYAYPSPAIDPSNGMISMAAVEQDTGGAKAVLFRCQLDGTGCSYNDVSSGHLYTTDNVLLPPRPTALLDSAGGHLLVVGCYSGMPGLARCALDGTACTFTDISGGHGAVEVQAVVDASKGKLVVVAEDATSFTVSLRECNLDGTGCVYTPVGSSTQAYVGWPALDATRDTLLAPVTTAPSDKLVLFRFSL